MVNYEVIQELYTKQECLELTKLYQKYINAKEPTHLTATGKNVDVSLMPIWAAEQLLQKFFNEINYFNSRYFGYDIEPFGKIMSTINFNNYTVGKEYPWHRDASPFPHEDIKLTAILNLSTEKYTGGEFELFLGDHQDGLIKDFGEPGSMIIFPSFIYHRVKPVTKGKRLSLSYWVYGKSFK
jgi:PKHD-type hydroxylase